MSNVEEDLDWLLKQGYRLAEAQWIKELSDRLQYFVAFESFRPDKVMDDIGRFGPTLSAAIHAVVDEVKSRRKELNHE